jgi:branched-subunit amino acid transport protein
MTPGVPRADDGSAMPDDSVIADDAVIPDEPTTRWTARDVAILGIGLLVAIAVRLVLLPSQGLRGDIDQFVLWTHGLTAAPFGDAYDQNLSFGPVMVYVWGLLAAIEPGFRTATDAADPGIRAIMKVPAVAADIGLALGVALALRHRPALAVAGGLAIALHPAVIYVSAWWGQYESVYLLAALVAVILAAGGRNGLAAVAIAIAVMTKPQALPLLVPFAAWFWAQGGIRGALRAGLIGTATGVVLWLPFIPSGGPLAYLGHLRDYQEGVFAVLSLRAWNPWWLLQEIGTGGGFASDSTAIIGPITFRAIGYGVTGLLALVVAWAVNRDPRPRTLVLASAAIVLVAFTFLTTMHERYAYGTLVFLLLLLAEPRMRWLSLVFGAVFTLNLVAAVPPSAEIGALLPVAGPLGIAGSIVMTALAVILLVELVAGSRRGRAERLAGKRLAGERLVTGR